MLATKVRSVLAAALVAVLAGCIVSQARLAGWRERCGGDEDCMYACARAINEDPSEGPECDRTQVAVAQKTFDMPTAPVSFPLDLIERRSLGSVVAIRGPEGILGAGVAVHNPSEVVTSLKLIEGKAPLTAVRADGTEIPVLAVMAFDTSLDLALLQVKGRLPALHTSVGGISGNEPVLLFGYPSGPRPRTIRGTFHDFHPENHISFKAPIPVQGIGSPVIDSRGAVLGIFTSVVDGRPFGAYGNALYDVRSRGHVIPIDEFARRGRPASVAADPN